MIERRVTVANRLGLHARAAAKLVRTASIYRSSIHLERPDGTAADAKSILSVLLLAASCGTGLRVIVNGADEADAANAVCSMFADGFGELEKESRC